MLGGRRARVGLCGRGADRRRPRWLLDGRRRHRGRRRFISWRKTYNSRQRAAARPRHVVGGWLVQQAARNWPTVVALTSIVSVPPLGDVQPPLPRASPYPPLQLILMRKDTGKAKEAAALRDVLKPPPEVLESAPRKIDRGFFARQIRGLAPSVSSDLHAALLRAGYLTNDALASTHDAHGATRRAALQKIGALPQRSRRWRSTPSSRSSTSPSPSTPTCEHAAATMRFFERSIATHSRVVETGHRLASITGSRSHPQTIPNRLNQSSSFCRSRWCVRCSCCGLPGAGVPNQPWRGSRRRPTRRRRRCRRGRGSPAAPDLAQRLDALGVAEEVAVPASVLRYRRRPRRAHAEAMVDAVAGGLDDAAEPLALVDTHSVARDVAVHVGVGHHVERHKLPRRRHVGQDHALLGQLTAFANARANSRRRRRAARVGGTSFISKRAVRGSARRRLGHHRRRRVENVDHGSCADAEHAAVQGRGCRSRRAAASRRVDRANRRRRRRCRRDVAAARIACASARPHREVAAHQRAAVWQMQEHRRRTSVASPPECSPRSSPRRRRRRRSVSASWPPLRPRRQLPADPSAVASTADRAVGRGQRSSTVARNLREVRPSDDMFSAFAASVNPTAAEFELSPQTVGPARRARAAAAEPLSNRLYKSRRPFYSTRRGHAQPGGCEAPRRAGCTRRTHRTVRGEARRRVDLDGDATGMAHTPGRADGSAAVRQPRRGASESQQLVPLGYVGLEVDAVCSSPFRRTLQACANSCAISRAIRRPATSPADAHLAVPALREKIVEIGGRPTAAGRAHASSRAARCASASPSTRAMAGSRSPAAARALQRDGRRRAGRRLRGRERGGRCTRARGRPDEAKLLAARARKAAEWPSRSRRRRRATPGWAPREGDVPRRAALHARGGDAPAPAARVDRHLGVGDVAETSKRFANAERRAFTLCESRRRTGKASRVELEARVGA